MTYEKLEQALNELREAAAKLVTIVDEIKAERDPLAAHIHHARRSFRRAAENDHSKSQRSSRTNALLSWKKAMDLGYRGSEEEWRRLMGALPPR